MSKRILNRGALKAMDESKPLRRRLISFLVFSDPAIRRFLRELSDVLEPWVAALEAQRGSQLENEHPLGNGIEGLYANNPMPKRQRNRSSSSSLIKPKPKWPY